MTMHCTIYPLCNKAHRGPAMALTGHIPHNIFKINIQNDALVHRKRKTAWFDLQLVIKMCKKWTEIKHLLFSFSVASPIHPAKSHGDFLITLIPSWSQQTGRKEIVWNRTGAFKWYSAGVWVNLCLSVCWSRAWDSRSWIGSLNKVPLTATVWIIGSSVSHYCLTLNPPVAASIGRWLVLPSGLLPQSAQLEAQQDRFSWDCNLFCCWSVMKCRLTDNLTLKYNYSSEQAGSGIVIVKCWWVTLKKHRAQLFLQCTHFNSLVKWTTTRRKRYSTHLRILHIEFKIS